MNVTEKDQKFTVKLPTQIMRENGFFKENQIYISDNVVKYDGLEGEVYVGENYILDIFTTVIE